MFPIQTSNKIRNHSEIFTKEQNCRVKYQHFFDYLVTAQFFFLWQSFRTSTADWRIMQWEFSTYFRDQLIWDADHMEDTGDKACCHQRCTSHQPYLHDSKEYCPLNMSYHRLLMWRALSLTLQLLVDYPQDCEILAIE